MKDNAKIIIGPVSVLSVVGKIYEKAMYKHLCGYLYCHNILYSLQFGFRQKWGGGGGGVGWAGTSKGRVICKCSQIGEGQTCFISSRGKVTVFLGKEKFTPCRSVDSYLLTNTRSV